MASGFGAVVFVSASRSRWIAQSSDQGRDLAIPAEQVAQSYCEVSEAYARYAAKSRSSSSGSDTSTLTGAPRVWRARISFQRVTPAISAARARVIASWR